MLNTNLHKNIPYLRVQYIHKSQSVSSYSVNLADSVKLDIERIFDALLVRWCYQVEQRPFEMASFWSKNVFGFDCHTTEESLI